MNEILLVIATLCGHGSISPTGCYVRNYNCVRKQWDKELSEHTFPKRKKVKYDICYHPEDSWVPDAQNILRDCLAE